MFSRPLLFHISWLYYCIKSSASINNQSTQNDNDFNTNLPRFMHQDKYESYYKARSPRCSWKFAIICANHYRPVGSSQTFNRIPLISYKQRNLYWRYYYNIKSILGIRGVHGSVQFGLDSKNQPNRITLILWNINRTGPKTGSNRTENRFG